MEKKKVKKNIILKILKKVVFIALFIVLLPFLLIFSIIKAFLKHKKQKKWEKTGLKGKALILKTSISDVDKMEHYELENYLKTLFFYDGYKVIEYDYKKDDVFFANRYNNDYVILFKRTKKFFKYKDFVLAKKRINKLNNGGNNFIIIVTNGVACETVKNSLSNNQSLVDRSVLTEMILTVQAKLGLVTKSEDLVDKFDLDINDKFPNYI